MGYSEVGVPVRRIPVTVQVSPVGIRIEPSNLIARIANCHLFFNFPNTFPA